MYLSPAQLQAIAADIKAMHVGWAVQTFGMAATGITPEVYQQLITGGYVQPQQVTDWALAAYQYGQVQGWQQFQGNYDPPDVPVEKIQALYDKALDDGLPPMNKAQQATVDFIRTRGAQYVVGLGNRVAEDFTTLAIESEAEVRAELREKIATETAESLIRRETAKKLASRLGNATEDWARDMDRIARTEIVNAQQEGQIAAWEEPLKKMGFRVAKQPSPDACKSCKKAYLMPDGTPRIFDEAELRANSTNFGRKQKDWLPTIGTLHPNCFPAGTMVRTPTGSKRIETVLPGDIVLSATGAARRVLASWASRYVGPMVTVDTGRSTLSSTPDHPISTPGGFVPASGLHEGSHVIAERIDDSRALSTGTDDLDASNGPAVLDKSSCFLLILTGFASGGVPVSAIYFDGELHVGHGDVYQKPVNLMAWYAIDCASLERIENHPFPRGFDLSGLSAGHAQDCLGAFRLPTHGIVGRSDLRVTSLLAETTPVHHASLAQAAWLAPGFADAANDSASGNAEAICYRFDRMQLIEVKPHDEVDVERDSQGRWLLRHAKMLAQPIAAVHSSAFDGVVYNLTVDEEHTYIVNGIAAHNCACQLVIVPPGFGFNKDGQMVPLSAIGKEDA